MRRHLSLIGAALALACGGSGATAPGARPSAPTYVAPPRPWAEMDHGARRAHMVQHVLPAATDLFTAYDAERYADFSCETCHGVDAATRDYAMPSPTLLTLYPSGTLGQERVLAEHTEACTFMFSRLVPAMQTMLGAPEYDAATGRGFTCFACHPRAGDDDPESRPASPRAR